MQRKQSMSETYTMTTASATLSNVAYREHASAIFNQCMINPYQSMKLNKSCQ